MYVPMWLQQNHEPRVAETAVVGYPHEIYGEGMSLSIFFPLCVCVCVCVCCCKMCMHINGFVSLLSLISVVLFNVGVFAFVILKNEIEADEKDIVQGLKDLVKKKIASFAVPNAFLVCNVSSLIHCILVTYHDFIEERIILFIDCPRPSKDTFWKDHATYSSQDSSKPTRPVGRHLHAR